MNDKVNCLFNKYNLNNDEKKKLLEIILPIINHEEFQRRMTSEFPHHGSISLGEHIIEDAIVTYKLGKKYQKKHIKSNYNERLAIIIAMLHDLYTLPWQNSLVVTNKFYNKHGFRHPIEAVINAINWYPEFFCNNIDAKIIVDGIIHHMYPLPVRVFNSNNNLMEINNYFMIKNINSDLLNIILESTKRKKLGAFSISRSLYKEGIIMSKADKKVSRRQINNFSSAKALLTGKNKLLKK